MYTIASSTTDINVALTNTGTVLAIVVASILIGMVALMGVGYAIRHIRKLIGRKF
jgi:carbon monoxide dehydrogenase subunit G